MVAVHEAGKPGRGGVQRRIDGILSCILHLTQHRLSLELVVQFLSLQQFPILLLEGVRKLVVLLLQVVMVQFHACGVSKRKDIVSKVGWEGGRWVPLLASLFCMFVISELASLMTLSSWTLKLEYFSVKVLDMYS